jgi:hypothetical protein
MSANLLEKMTNEDLILLVSKLQKELVSINSKVETLDVVARNRKRLGLHSAHKTGTN